MKSVQRRFRPLGRNSVEQLEDRSLLAADVPTIFAIASKAIQRIAVHEANAQGKIVQQITTSEAKIDRMIDGVQEDLAERAAKLGQHAAQGNAAAVANDQEIIQDLLTAEQQLAIYKEQLATTGAIALTADGQAANEATREILAAAAQSIASGSLRIYQSRVNGIVHRSFSAIDAAGRGLSGHYSNILDNAQEVKDKADEEEDTGNPGGGGGGPGEVSGQYEGDDTFGYHWVINLRAGTIRATGKETYNATVSVQKRADGSVLLKVTNKGHSTLTINNQESEVDTIVLSPDGNGAHVHINFDTGPTTDFEATKSGQRGNHRHRR